MAEPVAPRINALNRPFWDGAAAGRLMLPYCPETGRSFWPPSPLSPFAIDVASTWREVDAAGVVRSVVVYRRSFQKAFEAATPFAVGLIELDGGVRLLAHLGDPGQPGALKASDRAGLVFQSILSDGPKVLWAKPTRSPAPSNPVICPIEDTQP